MRFRGPFCESAAYLSDSEPYINQLNIFFSAALRALPLPVSLLTVPVSLNCFISLLMLLLSIVCLEIRSLTPSLYFLQLIPFLSKSCIRRQKPCFKYCDDVCNDVILMPQFLEVVRQHISGVVGNVMYLFSSKFN